MDWRHMAELLAAGEKVFSELKNVCVWNKTKAATGDRALLARTGSWNSAPRPWEMAK
jgi:hypothetical protein